MKYNLFPLILLGGIIIACNSPVNILQTPIASLLSQNAATLTIQAQPNVLETAAIVIARPNPENDLLTDIFIRSISSDEEKLLITLDHVNREHYHLGEYHNGNLYIIKVFEIPKGKETEWEEELWKYDVDGVGVRLWASPKGIDFRVSSNEMSIVYFGERIISYYLRKNDGDTYWPHVQSGLKLRQGDGETSSEWRPPVSDSLKWYTIQLDKWSDDGQRFWGEYVYESTPEIVFMFNSTSFQVREFDISHQNVGIEFELNANTGKVVYSNYPRMELGEEEILFRKSETEIWLFLLDLFRLTQRVIATSTAKEFHPKWINDTTIEYDDPLLEGNRIVLVVSEAD